MARDRCVDELQYGNPLADAHARIAALESQVAALAGALRDVLAGSVLAAERGRITREAVRALTADATHLAQLDAARRAVCRMMPDMIRLAEALYDQQAMPDDSGMPTLDAARAALDALARVERG